MNIQTIITATAPTIYQRPILKHFGMPISEVGNGSFTASKEFTNEEEAKDYLTSIAQNYFETDEELQNAYEDINDYNSLRIDGIRATIETV
jgi:hypothetical protein